MKKLSFLCILLLAICRSAWGENYHSVKVSELDYGAQLAEAKKAFAIAGFQNRVRAEFGVRCLQECHSVIPEEGGQGQIELIFMLEEDNVVNGFIDLDMKDGYYGEPKINGFPFSFTPSDETASTKERFEEARQSHYTWLAQGHLPGTAWFKHRSGKAADAAERQNWRRGDLEDTFGIFSGGRAISENLALDRDLILSAGEDGKTVALSEIKGITVPAIDWSSRLPEDEVAVDALSLAIPEDQHAVFAKNLPDLLALIERGETQFVTSGQNYSVRNPFRTLATRYRKQMGMDVPAIAARLLPVKSVAITGGDPYFPQGTDVAFVMESDTPELLFKALLKTISAKAGKAGAEATDLEGEGFDYGGFETADRMFSSHVWRMGGTIAVANSVEQIRRLMEVANEETSALGATDEYRFFRNRYPLAEDETAFIFLSDATIRRWAGPELRIAASRRTRAVAALGELTSQALLGEEVSKDYEPLLGDSTWQDGRMISSAYGSLGFITPTSELGIESATVPEKEAYERWRNGYENGWAQAFDPIAIRILSEGDSIAVDLSVIPLTTDSDFSEFVSLCGKAELSDMARWVPEESLFHAAFALDTQSELFQEYNEDVIEFVPGIEVNPLGWMSGSVSMDLQKSMFWLADNNDYFDGFASTPVVLRIGSNSRLKLALFMTAVRTAIESSAPAAVKWETRKNDGKSYVVMSGNEMGSNFRIYYATMPNALILSLREEPFLRALQREAKGVSSADAKTLVSPTQLMLDSSPAFLEGLVVTFNSTKPLDKIRNESWKALPILNEWHRRFSGKDAVATQLLHFGEDIYCPGGKGYRWNAEAMTMESVAFGYPANPKAEPAKIPSILDFPSVATSLEFEDDGLRASVVLGNLPKRLPTPLVKTQKGELLATAEELTPLKEGAVMNYRGKSDGMETTVKFSYKNIKRDENGISFDVLSEDSYGDDEDYSYTIHYVLDGGLKMISSSDGGEDFTKYSNAYLELPEKLVAGDVIQNVYDGTSTWEDEGELVEESFMGKRVIRVIGKEDIEVPAGKFIGCVRIEVVEESLSDGYFDHGKYLMWYHPDVGLVRYEYLEGQDSVLELHEYSVPD
ncbi:MAG: hypothetical protein ACSHX9_10955 [Luteolibacter sp.]